MNLERGQGHGAQVDPCCVQQWHLMVSVGTYVSSGVWRAGKGRRALSIAAGSSRGS